MKSSLLIVFLFFSILANAQRNCGTSLYTEMYKDRIEEEENLSISKLATFPVEGVITIPVVVHVIHNNMRGTIGGAGNVNISEEQILSQIAVLNEDFRRISNTKGYNEDPVGADAEIEFCLATTDPYGNPSRGIIRKYFNKTAWDISDDEMLKSVSYWPSDKYLNIWVTNLTLDNLGYSQFPEVRNMPGLIPPYTAATDGVVIDYEYFGTRGIVKSPYNYGRTATHEIGHWLGLLHIWGSHTCGDDYVEDTPWQSSSNLTGTCSQSSDCDKDGIYTADMVNNYMDYSYDNCMNIFTLGQKSRMRRVFELNARRNSLLESTGCLLSPITNKIEYSNKLSVHPNPSQGNINISFNEPVSGTGLVLNGLNEKVINFNLSGNSSVEIDLSHLSSGIYFLIIESEKGNYYQKIIKN